MFIEPKSKTLNRATILMLCVTSLLLIVTTFNHFGAEPCSLMLKLSFAVAGWTALILAFITPVSGVTLPEQVDLTFLYTESQIYKIRRRKYMCMVTILALHVALLVLLALFPTAMFFISVCLAAMIYLCYWLALHDIRLAAFVETYSEW